MSWRERLGYGRPLGSDTSDRSPASSTFVTSVTTPVDLCLVARKAAEVKKDPAKEIEPIPRPQVVASGEDLTASEARCEVARLLATAYRRLGTIRRVGLDITENSGKRELANSRPQSVHGGVE